MIIVVDASVALKWFFRMWDDEADVEHALGLLADIDAGRARMVQPPHFITEMGAVLAREKPGEAQADLADLLTVECSFVEDYAVYSTAIELSQRLQHHLFDTLYHATALHTPGATLVTADRRYYDKAREIGGIAVLADLRGSTE
ncbi:MAG: PIN domain-containing protein [Gammaproteobacteria bacterium HGW-Gammaproteobacteria-1]|nr:MAG: PIN domain-containing protein [Gammaproteobacteria bacterium HGW-Gammaproteobacteria-1]